MEQASNVGQGSVRSSIWNCKGNHWRFIVSRYRSELALKAGSTAWARMPSASTTLSKNIL